METASNRTLGGWGRYPVAPCHLYRPEKVRGLLSLFASEAEPTFIARGWGRSYGDPALNTGAGVIDMTRLNRMIAWDESAGLLTVEAGVSLAGIIEAFVPRGWFLTVTPGTKYVTVGGAIANDVHGKNHHAQGSFGQWVRSLELLTPEGEHRICSPEQHADLFWATVGGIGLTGLILTATLQLQRIETAYVTVDYLRSHDIEQALAEMAATDRNYQYSVAWIDCLARGTHLGRCVLMRGNPARAADLPRGTRDPYAIVPHRHKRIPFDFPSFTMNPLSVSLFNAFYYRINPTRVGQCVDYHSFFYPLDYVDDWNRLYGRAGFVQYQALFPKGEEKGLFLLLEKLSRNSRASSLAVLKCMGPGNPGLLSYPMEGYTLALDIPVKSGLVEFLRDMDRLLLDHGGRLYLAKDAIMMRETFEAMYPQREAFNAVRRRLDPHGRMSSTMARRLGLAPSERKAAS